MPALTQTRRYTPEEYLSLEEKAEFRSEFVDGHIFKMAGGTEAHNDITLNVATKLRTKLRGKCKAFASDMRIWVEAAGTFFYPDVAVVCGERKFHKNRLDTIENPTLLVEVLSKTTQEYDKNDKFFIYQNIDSFKEYVLIAQSKPVVQQYVRQNDGNWKIKATIGLNSKVYFESVETELSMQEIYDLVEFEQENL